MHAYTDMMVLSGLLQKDSCWLLMSLINHKKMDQLKKLLAMNIQLQSKPQEEIEKVVKNAV
ncbi:MAG: hypothetical protein ACK55Z_25955 [bacterium]